MYKFIEALIVLFLLVVVVALVLAAVLGWLLSPFIGSVAYIIAFALAVIFILWVYFTK